MSQSDFEGQFLLVWHSGGGEGQDEGPWRLRAWTYCSSLKGRTASHSYFKHCFSLRLDGLICFFKHILHSPFWYRGFLIFWSFRFFRPRGLLHLSFRPTIADDGLASQDRGRSEMAWAVELRCQRIKNQEMSRGTKIENSHSKNFFLFSISQYVFMFLFWRVFSGLPTSHPGSSCWSSLRWMGVSPVGQVVQPRHQPKRSQRFLQRFLFATIG